MVFQYIQEIAVLFIIIAIFSLIVKMLKQPIIIGYVLAGLAVSLFIREASETGEQIILMSEIGITFLLFLIGLEFDMSKLKDLGKDIFIASGIQSVAFFMIGFFVSRYFGFDVTSAVYIAIIFMFASTLLVAKWVEDKKEASTLSGKLTLGIMVFQDIITLAAITVLNIFNDFSMIQLVLFPLKGLLLLLIAFILAKYVLNVLFRFSVKYPELLFTLSLSICFFFVLIAPFFGYSATIGAFIAGVILANTDYANEIDIRLKSLILFFNILFFVGFGFQLNQSISQNALYLVSVLLLLSLLLKPLITYITLRIRGYDMKTSLTTGLYLSQISEFGIIIVMAGIGAGSIGSEIGAITVMLIVLGMIFSSYLIKYSNHIYKNLERTLLRIDGLFKNRSDEKKPNIEPYDVVFIGMQEFGKEIFEKVRLMGKKTVVIENDPSNIRFLKKEGIPFIYNSMTSSYLFDQLNFGNAELVISSIMDKDENIYIISKVKKANPKSTVIVTSRNMSSSLLLYNAGADYVIYPSYINEQNVTLLIEEYSTDMNRIIAKKMNDITRMKTEADVRVSDFNIGSYISWLYRKKDK